MYCAFKVVRNNRSEFLYGHLDTEEVYYGMDNHHDSSFKQCSGSGARSIMLSTQFQPYTGDPLTVVLKELLHSFFPAGNEDLDFSEYKPGDKNTPDNRRISGSKLEGLEEQPMTAKPDHGAFKVLTGDFVTTEDEPNSSYCSTFGADDYRIGKEKGVPPCLTCEMAHWSACR